MKKTLKKLTCGVLAAVSVFGCAATMTACETSNPQVEIEISFNGESYTLEYKLYRKTAPETVDHFMYLADNGYYDGLCVHDYKESGAMYTGGYSLTDGKANELTYKPYYQTIAKFKDYEDFPHSVWMDKDQKMPSYTLLGEFPDAHYTVESGAKKEEFGSLAMYYFDIDNTEIAEANVYTPYKKSDRKGDMRSIDYQYNHTTSMFTISLTTAEKTNNKYCTFATLKGDSDEELEALLEAIEEVAGEEAFTESLSMKVLTDDPMMKDMTQTESFNVPKTPIIIKRVEITKY